MKPTYQALKLVCKVNVVQFILGTALSLLAQSAAAQNFTSIKVNEPLEPNDVVFAHKFSPNSKYLVYIVSNPNNGSQLYSVRVAGGSPAKLYTGSSGSPGLSERELIVGGFTITPDNQYVIYRTSQRNLTTFVRTGKIFKVPITGGTPIQLDASASSASSAFYQLSNDGKYLVYLKGLQNKDTLYSVPVSGGNPNQLSSCNELDADVFNGGLVINQNSTHIVYRSFEEGSSTRANVFSVSIDGSSPPVKLNDDLVINGSISSFDVSADGSLVTYAGDQDVNRVSEVYRVPTIGGTITPIGPGRIPAFVNNSSNDIAFLKGSRLNGFKLYHYNGSNSTSTEISGDLVPSGSVSNFFISPDKNRIVYLADQDTDGVTELYSVLANGNGSDTKLNHAPLASDENVFRVKFSVDSARVIYQSGRGSFFSGTPNHIYTVPIAGGSKVKLSNDDGDNGSSRAGGQQIFTVSTDGDYVYYLGLPRAFESAPNRLYRTSIEGSTPQRVNVKYDASGIRGYAISQNNAFAAYSAHVNNASEADLFLVSLDGREVVNDELCVPVKAKNSKLAVICL